MTALGFARFGRWFEIGHSPDAATILDYSSGRFAIPKLGPELIINGRFEASLDHWYSTSGWSHEVGRALLDGNGSPQTLTQSNVFEVGRLYLIQFDANADGGSIGPQDASNGVFLSGADGRVIGFWRADRTDLAFKRDTGSVSGWIKNVSVREVLEAPAAGRMAKQSVSKQVAEASPSTPRIELGGSPAPIFDANFDAEVYFRQREPSSFQAMFNYERAGGSVFTPDSNGGWLEFPANEPPIEAAGLVFEPPGENHIRDSIPAAPATQMPSNWNMFTTSAAGISLTFEGLEQFAGLWWWLLGINGTATSASGLGIEFEERTQIVSTQGDSWVPTVFVRMPEGKSLPDLSGIQINVHERNSAGGHLQTKFGSNILGHIDQTCQRFGFGGLSLDPVSVTEAATERVQSVLNLPFNSGASIATTIAVAMPVMERGTLASHPFSGVRGDATITAKFPPGSRSEAIVEYGSGFAASQGLRFPGHYSLSSSSSPEPIIKSIRWGE